MPKYGKRSEENLSTCHEDLQRLFREVIKHYDCSVLSGYRDEREQHRLFVNGMSQLQYPKSMHNRQPSLGVDVVPYPIDWNDIYRFKEFMFFVKGVAIGMGIEIECGGQWTKFKDYPHFQLTQ